MRAFDLDLFLELNREYASKPLVPVPPNRNTAERESKGNGRAQRLVRRLKCVNARVLEIGCGGGETVTALATEYGCECVGVDVKQYPKWDSAPDGVRLEQRDITYDASGLGQFDFIISFSVWEHLRHPFAMLKQVRSLLRPNGTAFIYANLYRGPKASHRYREVFFRGRTSYLQISYLQMMSSVSSTRALAKPQPAHMGQSAFGRGLPEIFRIGRIQIEARGFFHHAD